MTRQTFFGLFLILFAGPTDAGDGVLEINSACINSGCFTGDNPGYPVELGQPGSYRLTSNLAVNQNTTAIVIEADNVELDLNGFSIRGPTTCSFSFDTGVSCSSTGIGFGIVINANRASIRDGSINGIGASCITADNDNAPGDVSTNRGHRIRNLTISNCGGAGIRIATGLIRSVTVELTLAGGFETQLGFVRDSIAMNTERGQIGGVCGENTYVANEMPISCLASINENQDL